MSKFEDELDDFPGEERSLLPVFAVYGLTVAALVAILVCSYFGTLALAPVIDQLRGIDHTGEWGERTFFDASAIVASVLVNGAVLSAMALIGGIWPIVQGELLHDTLARRFRFRSVPLLDVVIVSLGMVGLSMWLDGMIELSGLSDYGALAGLREGLSPLTGRELVAAALIMGVFPGFAEEAFFRGYMLRRLESSSGPVHALIGSSLAFGVFHLDPVHTPSALVMGTYLGYCAIRTGSIWATIAAHAVNNAAATFFATLDFDPGPLVLLTLCGAVAAVSAGTLIHDRHPRLAPRPW